MNEDLKRDIVTLNGTEDKGRQIILKTDKGFFSFWKDKRDGSETKAFETIKEIKPENGDTLVVMYKENEYEGKTYKNATIFYRPKEDDIPVVGQRPENPQLRNETIMTLVANQKVLKEEIEKLKKRVGGLETLNEARGDNDAQELHQSIDMEQPIPTENIEEEIKKAGF